MSMEDTISAIATPIGEGGLAVIRISGRNAFGVASRVFTPASPNHRAAGTAYLRPNRTYFGKAHHDGETLDEVVLTVFKSPHSYTCEDTAEISCHGGQMVARRILTATLQSGARLAQPGEFSRRAFLNGRIDLTQAEAVAELISATSEACCRAATKQLEGSFSGLIDTFRSDLIECVAHIEAILDFPEEGISPDTETRIIQRIDSITQSLQQIREAAVESRILREGYRVAIVGYPNVGKSSLLNALLGRDRAIVSPIPGTTRDTVEELVNLGGMAFKLIDTAGIRAAESGIEEEGIKRTFCAMHDADAVILVLDSARELNTEEREILRKLQPWRSAIAMNKSDLSGVASPRPIFPGLTISVSAKTGSGIQLLKDAILKFATNGTATRRTLNFLVNSRHEESVSRGISHLLTARECLNGDKPLELAAAELRLGLTALSEIAGTTTTEHILDRVFSRFCIGK